MSVLKLCIGIHVYSLVKPNHHSGELLSMLTRAEKKLLVEQREKKKSSRQRARKGQEKG